MVTRQEREAMDRFSDRYRGERADVVREIEQIVIGGDWGANGFTTIDQADGLAALLDLGRGSSLLDVGAGCGWPGLYLAAVTGCSVVVTDLSVDGLTAAQTRIRHEALGERASCVAAGARHPPFRAATFDAIVHTDVLC